MSYTRLNPVQWGIQVCLYINAIINGWIFITNWILKNKPMYFKEFISLDCLWSSETSTHLAFLRSEQFGHAVYQIEANT